MILPDVPSSLLLLSVLGALAGMILFLKFLHELSLTVWDL